MKKITEGLIWAGLAAYLLGIVLILFLAPAAFMS